VRVLLDEQLPRQLAAALIGHEVRTVQQQGWAGLKNGELLRRAAESALQVFVTADQNLEYQQNLARSPLGVVVLVAPSNALEDLLPLVPGLLSAIPESRPGQVMRVGGPALRTAEPS
jgi:predicted nuclease of predicted toxin-antitoxin system